MTPAQRQHVLDEAATWLRTPYHHMGRVKGVGVDCAMFPLEVYHHAGIIPPIEVEYYPIDWHMHRDAERYLEVVERFADPITEERLQPADFVVYRWGRCYAHGVIVIDWPVVIHSVLGYGINGVAYGDVKSNTAFRDRKRKYYTPKD